MASDAKLPAIGDRLIVTVRAPFAVLLSGEPRMVAIVEGELVAVSSDVNTFRAHRMWASVESDPRDPRFGPPPGVTRAPAHAHRPPPPRLQVVTIRIDVSIPLRNIAGIAPAPQGPQ